ncbi:hypothetical protein Tco_0899879 [Tanacetum coccineum]
MSSFGMKEGRFLDYIVTEEGLRADPGKVHAVILTLTLKIPNQVHLEACGAEAPLTRDPNKNGDSKRTWRRYNAMSMAKKRDNKLHAIGREGRNPDTSFLYKPTAAKNGNMLYPNRKKGASTNSHNKVPKKSL